ncbi:hypothetical protein CLOM_g6230 [Closterium sp. NIES-68]|nr:hypothetical protein CLOM_g6230 [Closterium sp. NIES-68]GJP77622.1 hypothetical protein CLOP_g7982 [Closterium sp. NIES-67]
MNWCYDICASFENNTFSFDPSSPTLSSFYLRGAEATSIIPSLKSCSINLGANLLFAFRHGCTNETVKTLEGLLMEQVSIAIANSTNGTTSAKSSLRVQLLPMVPFAFLLVITIVILPM